MQQDPYRDRGSVIIDPDECKGCGLCAAACVPKVLRQASRSCATVTPPRKRTRRNSATSGSRSIVDRPKGGAEGVAHHMHTDGADRTHLTQHVGNAGAEGNLDLLLPVRELGISGVEVHQVVKRDGLSGNTDDCEK